MKRFLLTLLLLSLGISAGLAQSQLGMNYQAVIRNDKGEIIANKEVGIQISILKESTTGTSVYTESFKPTTNDFGLINLVISQGKAELGTYSEIDWSTTNYFLKVELDAEGGTAYKEMGVSQLLSVPYANYALSSGAWDDAGTNITTKKKVEIVSDGKNPEAPLFEIKNAKGETIFAVYENGMKIILDKEADGQKTKGGFAISGRTTTKGEEVDILTVTPSLTEVFVEESTTKTKGGFAISGRTTTKAPVELLNITPSLTQFYVDETNAKTKGGFAISGRTTTKEGEADILTVTPSLTEVFVKESAGKTKGGFAISGRTTTKTPVELLSITPSLTQFYVDEPSAKTKGGFAISGRTTTKSEEADILTVTPKLTQVFVDESTAKTKGGFAISGRTTTKSSGIYDVFTVVPERTDVYVKPSPSKNNLPIGFGVHGLSENTLESTEFFSISGAGTYVATPMALAPTVITGIISDRTETSAFGAGKVTNTGGTGIELTASGIIYHNNSIPTLENVKNLSPGTAGIISGGKTEDFNLQMIKLNPATTYKVRAFAINSDGITSYGAPREFTTLSKVENTITVNVTDLNDAPIPNATVTFINSDIQEGPIVKTTNSSGSCTVQLSSNNYIYRVEADEYYAYTLDYPTTPTNNQEINVPLTPVHTTGIPVTFTVKDQEGNPVSGVSIKYNSNQPYEKYTNNEGVVILNLGTQPVEYWVKAPKGYADIPYSSFVSPDTEPSVAITLTKQFKVTFIVKDPQGLPATMTYGNLEKGSEWASIDVNNGIAEVFIPAHEALGIWTYDIYTEFGYFASGTIDIKEGDTEFETEVQLQYPPAFYTVRYRIVNLNSAPIVGAEVHLLGDSFDELAYSNAEGMVTFENVIVHNVPDMQYLINITKEGYGSYENSFELTIETIMVLDPNGTGTIIFDQALSPY